MSQARHPNAEREVIPLELFFDLVYVFAIAQLSHHLFEHVDLRTATETVILTLAVVYAWSMTAWAANWLDPERPSVKFLLIGLMFSSLLMSVAIPDAFADRAWLFVAGYLLLQVGRSAFLIGALRGRDLGEHFVNNLIWELLTGCLWIVGAVLDGDARLLLWGLAVAATLTGAWALHWLPGRGRRVDLGHTEIHGEHLLERFRLFFLIALGESVLTTGTAFANQPLELERLIALGVAFAGTVALWWCYFDSAEETGMKAAEHAGDAGGVGWLGTWTLTLIVLALIAIAVGDELAIAHPGDSPTLGFTLLVFGGPAVFLLAQLFFFRETLVRIPRSRPVALGALAILAPATAPLTQLVAVAASTIVLIAVAFADTARQTDRPASEPL